MAIGIFPSLIDADLLNLERVIKQLEPVCDGFHIDVMDNHYVPNLTWGPAFVNAIAASTDKPLEIHFMVDDPISIIQRCFLRNGDIITVHSEHTLTLTPLFDSLRQQKIRTGIALKPDATLDQLKPYTTFIDWVLIMGVKPGFSGQSFMPSSFDILQEVVSYRQEQQLKFTIAMDGGINEHNIAQLAQMGCEAFAIASAIFSKPDPIAAIKNLRRLCQKSGAVI